MTTTTALPGWNGSSRPPQLFLPQDDDDEKDEEEEEDYNSHQDPREHRLQWLRQHYAQQQQQHQQHQPPSKPPKQQPDASSSSPLWNYLSKSPLLKHQHYNPSTTTTRQNKKCLSLPSSPFSSFAWLPSTTNEKEKEEKEVSGSTAPTPTTAGHEVVLQREDHVSLECLNPESHSPLRQSSRLVAMMNLVATVCGGGVLSLPWAVAKAGIVPTTLLLVAGATVTYHSLVCLMDAARTMGGRSYGQVAAAAFGKSAQIWTNLSLATMLSGSLIAYQVLVKDVWTPVVWALLQRLVVVEEEESDNNDDRSNHWSDAMTTTTTTPSSLYDTHHYSPFHHPPSTTNPPLAPLDHTPSSLSAATPEQANVLLAVILLVALPLLLQHNLHALRHFCYIGFGSCLVLGAAVAYRAAQQVAQVSSYNSTMSSMSSFLEDPEEDSSWTRQLLLMTGGGPSDTNDADRHLKSSSSLSSSAWSKDDDHYHMTADDTSFFAPTTMSSSTTTMEMSSSAYSSSMLWNFWSSLNWWSTDVHDWLVAFPIVILCYFCSYNVLAVQAQLMHPTRPRMQWVLRNSLRLCCALFWSVGVAGYIYTAAVAVNGQAKHASSSSSNPTTTTTTTTPDNLLVAFDLTDPAILLGRIGFCFTLLFGLPLILLPCREAFLSLPQQIQAWRRDSELIRQFQTLNHAYQQQQQQSQHQHQQPQYHKQPRPARPDHDQEHTSSPRMLPPSTATKPQERHQVFLSPTTVHTTTTPLLPVSQHDNHNYQNHHKTTQVERVLSSSSPTTSSSPPHLVINGVDFDESRPVLISQDPMQCHGTTLLWSNNNSHNHRTNKGGGASGGSYGSLSTSVVPHPHQQQQPPPHQRISTATTTLLPPIRTTTTTNQTRPISNTAWQHHDTSTTITTTSATTNSHRVSSTFASSSSSSSLVPLRPDDDTTTESQQQHRSALVVRTNNTDDDTLSVTNYYYNDCELQADHHHHNQESHGNTPLLKRSAPIVLENKNHPKTTTNHKHSDHHAMLSSETEAPLEWWNADSPVSNGLATILILMVTYSIAITVPGVALVWSIVGSSLAIWIAFVVPAGCFLRIRQHKGLTMQALNAWLLLFGALIAMVLCTHQAVGTALAASASSSSTVSSLSSSSSTVST